MMQNTIMSAKMQYVSICLIKQLYEVWVGEEGSSLSTRMISLSFGKQIVYLILYKIFSLKKTVTPANEQCILLIPDLTQYLNSAKSMLSLLTSSWLRPLLRELSYCCFSSFISIQHSMNSPILDLTPYIAVSSQCQSYAVMYPSNLPFGERVILLALPLSQVRNSSFIWNLPIQHSMNSAESNPWPNSMYQCQASVKVMPPLRSLKTALCWESYPGRPPLEAPPPPIPCISLTS